VHAGYEAFRSAAEATACSSVGSMSQLPSNAPGARSWPITGASFILIDGRGDQSHDVLEFFNWALHEGEPVARRLGYVPIPKAALEQLPALRQSVRDARGKALWP